MGSLERFARAPWHDHAACSGESSVRFYPPSHPERRAARLRRESRARAVCASCPVRDDCLQHAIDHGERYGIWGGLTDRERRLASSPSAGGEPRAGDAHVVAPAGDPSVVELGHEREHELATRTGGVAERGDREALRG